MNDTGQKNSFSQFPKVVEFGGHPSDLEDLSDDRLNLGIGNSKIWIFFSIYRMVLNKKND